MIVSLARANLLHDWRRHATAIVVLVLAGLLMTIQLGFVAGFMESFTALQRQVRADIVVQSVNPFGRGRGRMGMLGGQRVEERFHDLSTWISRITSRSASNAGGAGAPEGINARYGC